MIEGNVSHWRFKMNTDSFLEELTTYLIERHYCHTIILYGSYSSGDYTPESDVDIVGFADGFREKNDTIVFLGKQLDAWIYPTKKHRQAEQFLQLHKGDVLLDERNIATRLLRDVDRLIHRGPGELSMDEKNFLIAWLWKMESRARRNDIEGNYRRNWLLVDSLEIYFELRGEWYFGPKKSLAWIKKHDQTAYRLFERAFVNNVDRKDIVRLIAFLETMAFANEET